VAHEIATFGGGCFWCTEAVFVELRGVEKVESGYAGGEVANPSYEAVCTGRTGHAEVIQITFDPAVIGYRDLLEVFFATHDPTTLNRQGADVGTQYRSVIFYHSPEQQAAAEAMIAELNASGEFASPIVTQVVPYTNYYPAEDYHQNYYAEHPTQPYCSAVIPPKLAKLRQKFAAKLK
jgi:peptide-methionine (S)-S-oxide reductase